MALTTLKERGDLTAHSRGFGGVDFVALCVLGLSFVAGIVAITRSRTSRVAPAVALLIVLVLGKLELLGAFMALAELPFLALVYLLRHL